MILALLSWCLPTFVIEPSGAEWVQALRRSGYRPTFSRMKPFALVRAQAVARQNVDR